MAVSSSITFMVSFWNEKNQNYICFQATIHQTTYDCFGMSVALCSVCKMGQHNRNHSQDDHCHHSNHTKTIMIDLMHAVHNCIYFCLLCNMYIHLFILIYFYFICVLSEISE
eukprot:212625_1